jgi:hypothetical protein
MVHTYRVGSDLIDLVCKSSMLKIMVQVNVEVRVVLK